MAIQQYEDLPVSYLPEIYRDVVDKVGLEAALALGEEFGGMSLYLPKIETALRRWRDKNIRTEFDGTNVVKLARKYRITPSRIRQILGAREEK